MALALAGPMPGRPSNSSAVALLMLIFSPGLRLPEAPPLDVEGTPWLFFGALCWAGAVVVCCPALDSGAVVDLAAFSCLAVPVAGGGAEPKTKSSFMTSSLALL